MTQRTVIFQEHGPNGWWTLFEGLTDKPDAELTQELALCTNRFPLRLVIDRIIIALAWPGPHDRPEVVRLRSRIEIG
jgi:hypothetical protein